MKMMMMSMYCLWADAGSAWSHMLWPGAGVLEKVIRPVIVYVFLVVGLRIFGKRELAQLNPFDFVVLISLSNTVQNAIIGDDNSVTGGLIGAWALLSINYLIIRFLFRHRRLDQILEGSPTVLVEHGAVIPDALARELVTEAELMMIIHRQGFATLGEVERCVLEPGGTVLVEGKEPRLVVRHHGEVLDRIEQLGRQIEALRTELRGGASVGGP